MVAVHPGRHGRAPFLVLSTAGPLLQRWFGATSHPRAKDPYFLFAAGNTGSLLALLSYPTLVEPRLTLDDQLRLWSWGYVAFVGLVVACAVVLQRSAGRVPAVIAAPPVFADASPALGRRLRWVALAALASSFMLGTTTYLSTDLAPVPLLWVVPLSLYLVTFIVAFALSRTSAAVLSRRLALLLPALSVPVVLGAFGTALPLAVQVVTHLALFTAVALVAHSRLAADRPGVEGLTGFYMLLALGGALGGAANALIAPVVFDRFYEYPIAIALAVLLVPRLGGRKTWFEQRYGLLGNILLVVVGLAALLALRLLDQVPALDSGLALAASAAALMGLLGMVGARSPRPYAVGLVLVLVVPLLVTGSLATSRTFFGVQQVSTSGGVFTLTNGSTVHGTQDRRPGRQREPRSYYHRTGPIGQLLADQDEQLADAELGFVGLGSGTLAAYGQPGQTMMFFEIDQATVAIAQDPRLFTYLADSQAQVEVVLGDGRLSLADERPGRFDVLVLDAFSSDAIPVHLLTREAVELYLTRLRPDGLLVFHISNRYLGLGTVLAAIAHDLDLEGLIQDDPVGAGASGKVASTWVVLSRAGERLGSLRADGRWQNLLERGTGERPWTDDFSNVMDALL